MERNKLDLVLDTSTLIHFFFGDYKTSEKIRAIISPYEKKCLTKIIRYEFRNIYLDFFIFIEIYKSIIKKIENNEIDIKVSFSRLLEEISRKYFKKTQQLGRLRMIYQRILENFHQEIFNTMIKGLDKSKNLKLFLLNRLETIIWEFNLRLKNVYDEITNYEVISDFNCSLYKWEYNYNADKDKFVLKEKRTCSKICFDIKKKILHFLDENQEYIDQILENYIKLSIEKKITDYDKDLISVLQNFKNNKTKKIGVKDCKQMGDLFISSIINNSRHILTRNKNHFLLLLLCKNRENSLIIF